MAMKTRQVSAGSIMALGKSDRRSCRGSVATSAELLARFAGFFDDRITGPVVGAASSLTAGYYLSLRCEQNNFLRGAFNCGFTERKSARSHVAPVIELIFPV